MVIALKGIFDLRITSIELSSKRMPVILGEIARDYLEEMTLSIVNYTNW